MIKRATSKRVTLPDGRTFLARYRRTTRDDLPPNINLPRVYKEPHQKVDEEKED